ncbi:dipeptidase [Anoxynatronum buryatiense]|uniref:Membrane dipeptidase n=1 Tax=Anoxynatronum buryatiense TaxID=489973 RepID=A0AA46AJV1_9CLOT|nr:dipeptidase [Anoxynatronum buryatiense]SMP63473.1 membrane dipeptidase [Anoxynatronum buryatiense]
MKNLWIRLVPLLVAALLCFGGITAGATTSSPRAEEIHLNAIVIDTHNDTMMKVVDERTWLPVIDIGGTTPSDFQLDIAKAKAGGLDVAFYAAYNVYQTDSAHIIPRTNSRTLALINALHWTAQRNRDTMVIARSMSELEKGLADGKHVAVATLEGMYAFTDENAIELLHQYDDLGVRAAGIVWNTPNSLGAGAHVANQGPDAGLTDLGKAVIREMNRLGIIVDVSHMNETTFYDTMAIVQAPVIASHSGVDGVRPHVRNLSDDQLLALKENGGVAHINFWSTTVADVGQTATIARLADHIDYVAGFIGVDHVGLGSDFDGAPMPVDLPNASYLPALTAELVRRGYSEEELEKILGGNLLRVFREVEALAHQSSSPRGLGFTILPELQPGEIIHNARPRFTANVISHGGDFVEAATFRVIVNGIVYEPEWHAATGILSLEMPDPLLNHGNFHVITFEGSSNQHVIARETLIVYVQ